MKIALFWTIAIVGIGIASIEAKNDCAPGSLSDLNLANLVEKSKQDATCLAEARKVFANNYKLATFSVQGPFDNGVGINNMESGVQLLFIINNFDVITYILENFGDILQRLSLSFGNISLDHGKELVKLVDEKCSATLQWLFLYDSWGDSLNDMKSVFSDVYLLKFSSRKGDEDVFHGNRKLNEIFPQLTRLVLPHTRASDWSSFIDGNITTLTELELDFLLERSSDSVNTTNIANFIKINRQIDTLTIWYTDLALLKEVSALPQLATLKLMWLSTNYSNYNGGPINFTSVKELTFYVDRKSEMPEGIFFDELKTLTLKIRFKPSNNWTDLILNQVNRNLTELELSYDDLTHEQFLGIPEELPHLKKLQIACKSKFVADHILDFLNNSNTKEMTFLKMKLRMDEKERNRLKVNLPDDWLVEINTATNEIVDVILDRSEYLLEAIALANEINAAISGMLTQLLAINDAYNTNSAQSLVVSHSTQLLAAILIFAFIKLR